MKRTDLIPEAACPLLALNYTAMMGFAWWEAVGLLLILSEE